MRRNNLRKGPGACNVILNETPTQLISYECWENSKNIFYRATASDCFCTSRYVMENKPSENYDRSC